MPEAVKYEINETADGVRLYAEKSGLRTDYRGIIVSMAVAKGIAERAKRDAGPYRLPNVVQSAPWSESYNVKALEFFSHTDEDASNAIKYPKYWRALPVHWKAIDTYRLNTLFPVQDDSGRLIHARKKLLIPGTRTGGKSMYDDIKEARDTLNGWLEDNQPEVK